MNNFELKIKSDAILCTDHILTPEILFDLLWKAKCSLKNYAYNFNGEIFYSLLDNKDSCCKKIFDMTYKEYQNSRKECVKKFKTQEKKERVKAILSKMNKSENKVEAKAEDEKAL